MSTLVRSERGRLPAMHARFALMTIVGVLAAIGSVGVTPHAMPPPWAKSGAEMLSTVANSSAFNAVPSALAGEALSTTNRLTPRWYLASPLRHEAGAWVLRGYVRNDETVTVSDLRLRITFVDGSSVDRPLRNTLEPGERIEYEFREVGSPEAAPSAVLLFRTAR